MMKGFQIITPEQQIIRFHYCDDAPVTAAAFSRQLPFQKIFFHARVSGQEIWTDDAPHLDIVQENASVFTEPGEVVIGPSKPTRVKTANAMGIYYGEGKGLDAANIFAKVFDEDFSELQRLGEQVWKNGQVLLRFSNIEEH